MTRDDVPTPALLLDLDRFERNLRRMAAHARAAGKHLRPHAKTHRCPEIARRQVNVAAQAALRFRGRQGDAGHCAHVIGWEARREASRAALAPLMETRALIERAGLPVEIVAGGSTGTWDIDVEQPGLTELQAGSYCVMDIDYRRIGGRSGAMLTDFEMALTVIATVVSVPTSDRAMVDGGLKAFSTDKPFPPESVDPPGLGYPFAGHG